MKMIPISAANASSVKRVKYLQEKDFFLTRQKKSKCFLHYLTIAERSNATIRRQNRLHQRPIHRRKVM